MTMLLRRSSVCLAAALVALAPHAAAKVTLRLMVRDGGTVVANIKKIVAEFEALHPNIDVVTEDSSYTTYVDKLLTQVIARSAPDVAFTAMGNFRILARAKALAPLGKFVTAGKVDLTKYYDSAIDSGRYGGQLYAWPYDGGSYALHYNRDLFDATGVAYPDETWTWDKVLDASRKMLATDGSGKITRTGLTDLRYLWWYFTWLNGGDIISKNGKVSTLSSPECLDAVKWLAELTNKYGLMAGGTMAPSPGFMQGKVGMDFNGRWAVPATRLAKFKWDAAVAPRGKVGELNLAFYSGFSMLSTTRFPKESWELINYVGGEPGQRMLCALGQQVPAIRALAESSVFLGSAPPANNRAYLSCMEKARSWPTHYITAFGGRYSEIVDPLLAQVWRGSRSPEQVLTRDLDARLAQLLGKN